jgi:tRNA-guanine family transglycosylase
VVSVALGADMFDCVWPTRTARFGNAITDYGVLSLRRAAFNNDFTPIDPDCKCVTCRPRSEGGLGITKAYLNHLAAKETVGAHLVTIHNVHYQLDLMRRVREAILEDRYPAFVKMFFGRLYPGGAPKWAVEALQSVGVDLS